MTSNLAFLKPTKTILLTTYKRDGSPVATPVSIAFEGDRAFFRSYDKAWKSKRLRNDPRVAIAPAHAARQADGADCARTGHAAHRRSGSHRRQGAGASASPLAGRPRAPVPPGPALSHAALRAARRRRVQRDGRDSRSRSQISLTVGPAAQWRRGESNPQLGVANAACSR
jgi:hypothetical protein